MSSQYVNTVPTTWVSAPTIDTTIIPNVPVTLLVIWDAGYVVPVSSTTWDSGTANWKG